MKKCKKKTIEIGGRTFKVTKHEKMPKAVEKELGYCAGWEDWNGGEIGLVGQFREDGLTLFHEIGHASADAVRATNPLQNESFARPFFAIFFAALKDAGMIKNH